MGKSMDLTARRFGKLVVLRLSHLNKQHRRMWLCRCDCGTETVVGSQHLMNGTTSSCGCYARQRSAERGRARMTSHGACGTPAYLAWQNMLARCNRPANPNYAQYGGRGIMVCERWSDFAAFLADMGPRPSTKHSIDRIDNDGHYEPGNCRWATKLVQTNNTRSNHFLEYGGKRLTIAQWARETSLTVEAIRRRIRRGWPISLALTVPVDRHGNKHFIRLHRREGGREGSHNPS
jgi:hypothetical protein